MDASSLAVLLHQIHYHSVKLLWDSSYRDRVSIAREQLRIVRWYALNLGVDSYFSLRMHQNWSHNEVWERRSEPHNHQIVSQMLLSFLRDDLKELFKLPKSSHFAHQKPLKKNELVAIFIGFLLQILHHGKGSAFMANFQALTVGLRSLFAILGDTPFQDTDHQQLQSIIPKFEQVANEAGSIVHYAFFSPDPLLEPIDDALAALLQQIDILRRNISNSLNLLVKTIVIGVIPDINSFFIVDSLLYDLEDLKNQDLNLPLDVKDLIRMLHQRLKPFQSLIKDVESPKLWKDEGSEEVMVRIRDD